MADLFNSDEDPIVDQNKNYLEELVGENKKFKTPEELARGKAESDAFIERLKAEAAGLRDELKTRLRLEEAIDKIASATPKSPSSEREPEAHEQDREKPAITPEDIEKLLDKKLFETERKTKAQSNLEYVESQLQEAFGPTFRRTLKEQSARLGLEENFLKSMAAEQPQAFLKLFDVTPGTKAPREVVPPRNQINSDAQGFRPNVTGEKRKSYFDNIRKTRPGDYWSPAVQNDLHREAIKQGEAFFDN